MAVELKRIRLGPNGQLYHLHIPKTAGTSVRFMIEEQFDPEEVCPAHLWDELVQIPRDQLREYRFFSGHFLYGLRLLLGHDPIYVTFLRDPVDQMISHYEHIKRYPEHGLHNRAMTISSAEEFFSDQEARLILANSQARHLVLGVDSVATAAMVAERALDPGEAQRAFQADLAIDVFSPDLLERATARLEAFAFVGLVERLPESMRLLSYTFGWDILDDPPRLNVGPARSTRADLPPSVLQKIGELTELDAALYRSAQEILSARVGQLTDRLRGDPNGGKDPGRAR